MGKSSMSYAFTPVPPARGNFRPPIMSALAGLWRGHLMGADDDVSVPFTLIRDASVDASVVGRFLFFMTKGGSVLVGNDDFGYTLNRGTLQSKRSG